MKKIKENTLSSLYTFKDDIKKSLVFHIPHSSVEIPIYDKFNLYLLNSEIEASTDFETDSIFDVNETTKIVFPYSRVFCDVERLNDDKENLYKFGRGFYYTHTHDNKILREIDENLKSKIYNEYYKIHHDKLTQIVEEKLNGVGFTTIIDCHSFPNIPYEFDLDKTINRPDICLGIDNFHTPSYLIQYFKSFFESKGYKVKINSPYSGTIVPLKFYTKNINVKSIMIEINRDLYMKDNKIIKNNVFHLNSIINELFNFY